MANRRLTDSGFIDSFKEVDSFFVNKDNAVKQIDKSNIVFDIENGGTGAIDAETARKNLEAAHINHTHTLDEFGAAAVNHTHMPESIGAAEKSTAFSLIIPISSWGKTGMTAVVSFASPNILNKNIVVSPFVDMDAGEDYYEIWSEYGIHAIKQLANSITFACTERPNMDIKASILVVG